MDAVSAPGVNWTTRSLQRQSSLSSVQFFWTPCVEEILLKNVWVLLALLGITKVYHWQSVLSFILRIFRMFCKSQLLFDFLSIGRISNTVHRVECLDSTNLPGLSIFSSCCTAQCYRHVLQNFLTSDWDACLCWFSFKVIQMHTQMHTTWLRKLYNV